MTTIHKLTILCVVIVFPFIILIVQPLMWLVGKEWLPFAFWKEFLIDALKGEL